MTAQELATKITGRELPFVLTHDEAEVARASGLLVCFGESDDSLEFRGIYTEEVGAWEGRTIGFRLDQLRVVESDDCKQCLSRTKVITVTAVWCPKSPECSWVVIADEPFVCFDIMEGGKLFCRGAVICTRPDHRSPDEKLAGLTPLSYFETTVEDRVKIFVSDFGEPDPCPFCGRTSIDYVPDEKGFLTCEVECQKCGAKAFDARWNRRRGKKSDS